MSGSLHIDRMEVRVRGGSPEAGRALADELHGALRPALEGELRRRPAGRARIARVAASAALPRGAPAHRAAAAVARAVADALSREVEP